MSWLLPHIGAYYANGPRHCDGCKRKLARGKLRPGKGDSGLLCKHCLRREKEATDGSV